MTTYDAIRICFDDLRKIPFNYVIFDEAHKLKNADSIVSQLSRLLKSKNRLLLTGTPLQNNIGELWCLLNFLMPALFESEEDFKEAFDFSQMDENVDEKLEMVKKLHKILKPFMLRRVKADLEVKLPDKIEINLSVPLTKKQIDLYTDILTQVGGYSEIISEKESTSKSFSAKGFNNVLMQLRKCCNHPYVFPGTEPEGAEEYGEHIVEASGKLIMVDKLAKKIFRKKEQMLLFSGFT